MVAALISHRIISIDLYPHSVSLCRACYLHIPVFRYVSLFVLDINILLCVVP